MQPMMKSIFFYIPFKIITWYDNIVCILIICIEVVGDMSLSTHRERYDFQRLFSIIHHCMWMIWRGYTCNFFDLRKIWLWKDSKINPLCFIGLYILITKMCFIHGFYAFQTMICSLKIIAKKYHLHFFLQCLACRLTREL